MGVAYIILFSVILVGPLCDMKTPSLYLGLYIEDWTRGLLPPSTPLGSMSKISFAGRNNPSPTGNRTR